MVKVNTLILTLLLTLFISCNKQEKKEAEVKRETASVIGNIRDRARNLFRRKKDKEESVWTTWSRKGTVGGLRVLTSIRDNLFENNLHDTYEEYPEVNCPPRSRTARMEDGSCNDKANPAMGMAGVALGRNVPLDEVDFETGDKLMTPNPRLISRELLTRDEFKPIPFLNLFTTAWIQFMNHDWFDHDNAEQKKTAFLMDLEEDDPFAQKQMMIFRTKINDEIKNKKKVRGKRFQTYKNSVTHWWDASQVYGSSKKKTDSLRLKNKAGKLTAFLEVTNQGHLPMDSADDIRKTGFKENWWIGMSLLHHLFVKEHNAIVHMLTKKYPELTSQQLFDKARLVNAAIMAKIHTVEWTPAVLPNKTLARALNANWYGVLNPQGFQSRIGKLIARLPGKNRTDWRIRSLKNSHVFGGIVGGKKDLFNSPFNITEEFTSVYRLHPLLPESLKVVDIKNKNVVQEIIPLEKTRKEMSKGIVDKHGLEKLIYSFGKAHAGQLVLNNYPRFLQDLDMPLVGKMDLGTVEILRDRERGVPRYNKFRRLIGLKPITKFEDFFLETTSKQSKTQLEKLKRIYNNDVEQIDLLVGSLAEQIRPKYFGFGETAFQIFILMASRRLMADRFFTTDYTSRVYTKAGLKWIDKYGDFKSVVTRHYPSLKKAFKRNKSAFGPWK